MKKIIKEITVFMFQLALAIIIAVSFSSGVYGLSMVDGPSMENTLQDRERLLVSRISYKLSEPEHEDIIIFLKGETIDGFLGALTNTFDDLLLRLQGDVRSNRLVKRVIGIPGDTIDIVDMKVYRNDQLLEETYIKGDTFSSTLEFPILVPEGKIFVLGDNREKSEDSRRFGLVDYESIEGKVVLRFWPFTHFGD